MSDFKSPPNPKIEPHWQKFRLPFQIGSGRSFIPGESAIRMAFFKDGKTQNLVGRVWFGEGIEGPPGHVHGGVSAFVLDEAMGSAGWLRGYACVAASIEVDFMQMTPLGVDFLVEALVEKTEGRQVYVSAEIRDEAGVVYSRSRGRFHRLAKTKVVTFLKGEGIDPESLGLKFVEDEK